MKQCPICGSKKIRRSHTKNLKERFLKLFLLKFYRCFDCGWRGSFQQISSITKRKLILNIICIVIIIITIIAVLRYISMELYG